VLAWLRELGLGKFAEAESGSVAGAAFVGSIAKSPFALRGGALCISPFTSAFTFCEIPCGLAGKAAGLSIKSPSLAIARATIKTTFGLRVAELRALGKIASGFGAELPYRLARVWALSCKSVIPPC
jgi:hypothetical protein